MSLLELGAFEVLRLLADHQTGIWWGCALSLRATCGNGQITLRMARRILENLESKGYIKRFAKKKGRGNYAVIINKFECSGGAQSGSRVNAALTKDWRNVVYELWPRDGLVGGLVGGTERASIQEREVEKETEKNTNPNSKTNTSEPAAPDSELGHPLYFIWKQEHGNLPDVTMLTKSRLKKCRDRVKNHASDPEQFLADFRNAVVQANQSAFLTGQTSTWKATFDWFVNNDENYIKVLEGNYKGTGVKRGRETAEDRIRQSAKNSGLNSEGTLFDRGVV